MASECGGRCAGEGHVLHIPTHVHAQAQIHIEIIYPTAGALPDARKRYERAFHRQNHIGSRPPSSVHRNTHTLLLITRGFSSAATFASPPASQDTVPPSPPSRVRTDNRTHSQTGTPWRSQSASDTADTSHTRHHPPLFPGGAEGAAAVVAPPARVAMSTESVLTGKASSTSTRSLHKIDLPCQTLRKLLANGF